MRYIASKNLVHRDLAARNVLLFSQHELVKISDFGLCCAQNEEPFTYQASAEKLPIKWLALESLTDKIFSEKSDVWSFGVLMHEMFTLGKTPYGSMNYDELLVFLQAGGRLEKPLAMDEELAEIVCSCWEKESEHRPYFKDLEEKFINMNTF